MLYQNPTQKKEHLFSLNRMNKYYLFPFLVPIVCFSTKFFSEIMKVNDGEIKDVSKVTEENCHSFVFLYEMINSTSIIFSGLLYFVSIIRNKTNNKANIGNNIIGSINTGESSVLQPKNKSNRLFEILLILGMSLIISSYNILKGYAAKHPTLEKRLYFLFFFTLINLLIFKKPIYRHQIVSLTIGGIGMVMIFGVFFYYNLGDKYEYIYDVLLFFGSFLYSLYLVLVKYMSDNKGYSPFLLLFLIGIFSTIMSLVGYMIYSKIRYGDLTIISNMFHCRDDMYVCFEHYYVKIIMYFIINAILQVLIFLVCYYFSPEVFAISDIISPFLSFVYGLIDKKDTRVGYIILDTIAYIIIILASFVYNEIIVCNFWHLNENTWKAITKKAENDYLGIDEERDSNLVDDYELNRDYSIRRSSKDRTSESEMSSSINNSC